MIYIFLLIEMQVLPPLMLTDGGILILPGLLLVMPAIVELALSPWSWGDEEGYLPSELSEWDRHCLEGVVGAGGVEVAEGWGGRRDGGRRDCGNRGDDRDNDEDDIDDGVDDNYDKGRWRRG